MADRENVQYSLLSSTRFDDALLNVPWNTRVNGGIPSQFMLLPYHFDRLAAAAGEHGWTTSQRRMAQADLTAACNDAVIAAQTQHGYGPLRLRILLASDGKFSATATAVSGPRGFDIPSMPNDTSIARTLYIDPEPTTPSVFTRTKTTHRHVYNAARSRVKLPAMPTYADAHIDVLLHNTEGLVMETSIRNVAFRRGDQWVTPTLTTGCLSGVMRRLMLEEKGFAEQNVNVSEVTSGEVVLTFNGVEGIHCATIARFPWNGQTQA
ncbi:aminotransferase class IV-domain-containing protein [Cytidiella melzeri]|nr:aminotransferase class IV-domain-containing protein [Cytidiella melzeri]